MNVRTAIFLSAGGIIGIGFPLYCVIFIPGGHDPAVATTTAISASRPSGLQPGLENLRALLATIPKFGDPQAADRLQAVIDSLAAKRIDIDAIDGVPIAATVEPALWLKRHDILLIKVLCLGKDRDAYEVDLIGEKQKVRLGRPPLDVARPVRFRLMEGVWVHIDRYYVDQDWMPVSSSAELRMSEQYTPESMKWGLDVYEQLHSAPIAWSVAMGDQIARLAVPEIPQQLLLPTGTTQPVDEEEGN